MSESQTHGPHLVAAVFCDQVLEEKDGVLSAIRLVDRVNVTQIHAQPGDTIELPIRGQLGTAVIMFTLLVVLKSGDFKGRGKLGIVPRTPSGKILPRREIEVELLGAEYGANAIIRGGFPPNEEGVYWIDVYFNDRLLTSSPLAVRFEGSGQQSNAEATTSQIPGEQKRS